jgi:hypothetical protein
MTAKVTGAAGVKLALENVSRDIRAKVENECHQTAERVRSRVVVDINTQKPNPDYVVPKGATGRRRHIPAPAGGPPNADTGRLSASYTTTLESAGSKIRALLVAGTIYAAWLEFGTSRMAARPHLLPRFHEAKGPFVERMRAIARDAVREANKKGRRR